MVTISSLLKVVAVLAVPSAFAAVNYPPIPADKTTPVQQRLAFHAPGAVTVGWNTFEQLDKPCVKYGTTTAVSSETCSTSSITYSTSRTWSNAVTLTGLSPATVYYYKIVSGNSSMDHFKSALTAGDDTPYNASVVIDLGVYGENGYTTAIKRDIPGIQPALEHATIGALANTSELYDFVVHPGDLAYADDWADTPSNIGHEKNAYEAILENFYGQLAPVAARKQYMVAPGNHEADCTEDDYSLGVCPEGQYNFTDYMNRFGRTMPLPFPSMSKNATAQANAAKAAKLSVPPFWFSYEYGQTHFTYISTETDFKDAPDGPSGSSGLDSGPFAAAGQQLAFLKADLASVDRSVTPWLIVAGHRPWYSVGEESDRCVPCQAAFEDLLYEYGVDVAIFGHIHNAQRFLPIYNGTLDPAGMDNPTDPMYLVVGGAGNIEGLTPLGDNATGNVFAYDADYTFGRLRFIDRNNLGFDFYRSRDLELLDSSVLYKEHNVDFVRN